MPTLINKKLALSIPKTALFLSVAEATLAVWRSEKRYNIETIKLGRNVYYFIGSLNKFIGANENELDFKPLYSRKTASLYLSQFKPVSPGTLAQWDFTKRHDLQPLLVGGVVRYRKASLDRLLQEWQTP